MNDKKSAFGKMCEKLRVDEGMSEEEMGQKLGYKAKTAQATISTFERKLDNRGTAKGKHRDPTLQYVEKCAKLFGLDSIQKFELFYAALDSCEELRIDMSAVHPHLKKLFIRLVLAIVLGKSVCPQDGSSDFAPFGPKNVNLNDAWKELQASSNTFLELIKSYRLSYLPKESIE
jgi:transcriptional regulator with XRE-family HTH domain